LDIVKVFVPRVTRQKINEAVSTYPFLSGLEIRPIENVNAAATKAFNDYNRHAELTSSPEVESIVSTEVNEERDGFDVELRVPNGYDD
jgi:hypothetical protein